LKAAIREKDSIKNKQAFFPKRKFKPVKSSKIEQRLIEELKNTGNIYQKVVGIEKRRFLNYSIVKCQGDYSRIEFLFAN